MNKTIFIIFITIAATIAIGYGVSVLYEIVMDDVSVRLKQAIAEGIQEGITATVNPLNWPQALLRG